MSTFVDFGMEPDSGLPFHEWRPRQVGAKGYTGSIRCGLCGFTKAHPVHTPPPAATPSDETPAQLLDGTQVDVAGDMVSKGPFQASGSVDLQLTNAGQQFLDALTEANRLTQYYLDATVAAEHKGTMVALFPPKDVADKVGLDEDDAEDKGDLHVTLVYLPDGPGDGIDLLHQTVADVAAKHPPLSGKLGGLGHFNPSEGSDGKPVAYAPVDVPYLSKLREEVADRLTRAGFKVADNHGFTPHMTLKYAEHSEKVPDTPVTFDQVTVAKGDERTHFPLKGGRTAIRVSDRLPKAEPVKAIEEKAFFTEVNNRTFLTGPAYVVPEMFEQAKNPNNFMKYMAGRLVGAEEANRNGAFWSTGDLEFGLPTVAHGPLNWLHEARHVIGAITAADLVNPTSEQAADGMLPHIQAMAGMWQWIYPDEIAVVEQASEQGKLYYSMECVSNEVACVGEGGCGTQIPYMAYLNNAAGICSHLKERAGSHRRLVEPTFLGAAVIVPPVRPGWADAHAAVMKAAATEAEKAHEVSGNQSLTATEWEQLMASVFMFAGVTDRP